jgi:hypothetical protein
MPPAEAVVTQAAVVVAVITGGDETSLQRMTQGGLRAALLF